MQWNCYALPTLPSLQNPNDMALHVNRLFCPCVAALRRLLAPFPTLRAEENVHCPLCMLQTTGEKGAARHRIPKAAFSFSSAVFFLGPHVFHPSYAAFFWCIAQHRGYITLAELCWEQLVEQLLIIGAMRCAPGRGLLVYGTTSDSPVSVPLICAARAESTSQHGADCFHTIGRFSLHFRWPVLIDFSLQFYNLRNPISFPFDKLSILYCRFTVFGEFTGSSRHFTFWNESLIFWNE